MMAGTTMSGEQSRPPSRPPSGLGIRGATVPLTDAEALELAIIENIQRADLNPLEEAAGYQALASQYSHSQDDIAHIVGKSRSHVANTLRLLRLPDAVKAYINQGKLTAGHARALLPLADDTAEMLRVMMLIIARGWSVRLTERAVAARLRRCGRGQSA